MRVCAAHVHARASAKIRTTPTTVVSCAPLLLLPPRTARILLLPLLLLALPTTTAARVYISRSHARGSTHARSVRDGEEKNSSDGSRGSRRTEAALGAPAKLPPGGGERKRERKGRERPTSCAAAATTRARSGTCAPRQCADQKHSTPERPYTCVMCIPIRVCVCVYVCV